MEEGTEREEYRVCGKERAGRSEEKGREQRKDQKEVGGIS